MVGARGDVPALKMGKDCMGKRRWRGERRKGGGNKGE